ncbi:MAG: methylated-DNA--[protein]-cysteine S-methyltransferase [Myxococcota bacterium]|nr:methylated-DNA--[protein]-cysteine S-methyltransferase [Myxococcota bacterium]
MESLSFAIREPLLGGRLGGRLGALLVAASPRGVSHVRFGESREALEAELRRDLPYARLVADGDPASSYAQKVAAAIEGAPEALELPLDVPASRFQRRVFEALCAIPRGETRSYAEIAAAVGSPAGARAVARVCATNPVPVVVPCHRVVPRSGGIGGYLGGAWRKRALLDAEAVPLAPLAREAQPAQEERAVRVRTR